MNKGFNNLWPTPVYLDKINNEELVDQVCRELLLNVDLSRMLTEFQAYDILHEGPELFQQFRDQVVLPFFETYLNNWNMSLENFLDYRLKSWLTGAYPGYSIPVHNHSGASLSAIFYLLVDDEIQGGNLIFLDPRANANRGYVNQFKPLFENKKYAPKSGEGVVFPSFLYHQTLPFSGSIRLAMPVDLFF
jgi:hypothetical protein